MASIKIPSTKISNTINNLSFDDSNSVNGNMNLIQEQIKQKTNNYINVKNSTRILEKYSNWNGYIKLYTEVENNFEVGDIVYITWLDDGRPFEVFVLDNNYNNDTGEIYEDPYNENIKDISFGYTILYVNKYANEVVINRRYSDIYNDKYKHCILKDQIISKISCRDGDFFGDISDGVTFFNCNIFNGEFGILEGNIIGIPSGTTAYIYSSGLHTTCDINGKYSLNIPSGKHLIKCKIPSGGYINQTVEFEVLSNTKNVLNFNLSGGSNSITISTFEGESVCKNSIINFYSHIIGYGDDVTYEWKINNVHIGSNNKVFSYNNFNDDDIVSCDVYDDFDILYDSVLTSNLLSIQIIPQTLLIDVSNNNIMSGEFVTFTAYSTCMPAIPYQWRINELIQYETSSTFTTSNLQNGDIIYCKIGTFSSNTITMIINTTTTTTTTTILPYVVLINIDGVRMLDSWYTPENIPNIINIASSGVSNINVNAMSPSLTLNGHNEMLSGKYEDLLNDGSQIPTYPSYMQEFLYNKNISSPTSVAKMIFSKDKLYNLSDSQNITYDNYRPYINAGVNGDGTGGYRDDSITHNLFKTECLNITPPYLSTVSYASPDSFAHLGNWTGYTSAIQQCDIYVGEIWNLIQSHILMANNTTLIITNDHGRKSDPNWQDHGGSTSEELNVLFVAIGPKIKENIILNNSRLLLDIPTTILHLYDMSKIYSDGVLMSEIFK